MAMTDGDVDPVATPNNPPEHVPRRLRDADDVEVTERVERFDQGVSITTELKRGTGTRDQDKHVLKAKGRTLDEAREDHARGLDYLADEVLDRARGLQPDGDGDD